MLTCLFAQMYENLEIISGLVHYYITDSFVTQLHYFLWCASVNIHIFLWSAGISLDLFSIIFDLNNLHEVLKRMIRN